MLKPGGHEVTRGVHGTHESGVLVFTDQMLGGTLFVGSKAAGTLLKQKKKSCEGTKCSQELQMGPALGKKV